jgi:hypothetical protein
MPKLKLFIMLVFTFLSLFTVNAYAWNNSIELGYGVSKDPNNDKYTNSAFLLNGDFYHFHKTPLTLWSINGAIGHLHSNDSINKNVTTAALSVALRLYPFKMRYEYPPYILGSIGPAYLSSKHFGSNKQASHFTLQSNLGLGVEFNHFDVNLRLLHYSNAYLAHPNQGFNVKFLLSLGYLF